jgi:hypothetical protein
MLQLAEEDSDEPRFLTAKGHLIDMGLVLCTCLGTPHGAEKSLGTVVSFSILICSPLTSIGLWSLGSIHV